MSLEAEIQAAEDARYRAMTSNDLDALAGLLGDDLVYTHSSAVVDDKAAYLESLRSGKVKYLAAKRDGVRIRGYGDTAVVHGHAQIEAEIHGERRSLDNLFVNVWVKRAGGWRMVHWASTAIPKK
jgi:ketosteroid isomerase-like protein